MATRPVRLFAEDLEYVTDAAYDAFASLRGARILLTGGTGFVGKWLLETLVHANARLSLGASIVIVSRRPDVFAETFSHLATAPGVSLHGGDVREETYPAGAFSHVIHAATDVAAQVTPLETFDVINTGTRRALDAAVQAGATRFLLVSSGGVYGPQPAGMPLVAEDYSGAPLSTSPSAAYGLGKRAAEWQAVAYGTRGLSSVIGRCFAFVGPYLPLNAHFAVGNFYADVLAGRPVVINGDGTPLRSYLYAADLARWLWVLLVDGRAGEAYNVGSDESVSIRALAERISALSRVPCGVQTSVLPVAGGSPQSYVPDVGKARALGLAPHFSLSESLQRTYRWLTEYST
jgi:dTDP-glucose 4,6-dehydratase